MPRVIGRTMPPLRAMMEGMPDASVTSLINSEYATPIELPPKRRTNRSARRLASPLSVRTREMSIAASTSQADPVP